ncbi:hypothetical protein BJ742DRAFT_867202 [Cladochytrium replicatum]|nr:hypothetical protein BJ742DRAFT_867202 [Cladochytrium replicatum]
MTPAPVGGRLEIRLDLQTLVVGKEPSSKSRLYSQLLRLRLGNYASLYKVITGISRATLMNKDELRDLKNKIETLKCAMLRWEAAGGGELLTKEEYGDTSILPLPPAHAAEELSLQQLYSEVLMPAYTDVSQFMTQLRDRQRSPSRPAAQATGSTTLQTDELESARELSEEDEIRKFGVRARYMRLISHSYPDRVRKLYGAFTEHQRLQRLAEIEAAALSKEAVTSPISSPSASPKPHTSGLSRSGSADSCPFTMDAKKKTPRRSKKRWSTLSAQSDDGDPMGAAAAAWPVFALTLQAKTFIEWMVHIEVDASIGCCGCGMLSRDIREGISDFAKSVGGDASYRSPLPYYDDDEPSTPPTNSDEMCTTLAFSRRRKEVLTRQMSDWFEKMCRGQVLMFLRQLPGLGDQGHSIGVGANSGASAFSNGTSTSTSSSAGGSASPTPAQQRVSAAVKSAADAIAQLLTEEFGVLDGVREWITRMKDTAHGGISVDSRDRERALVLHLLGSGTRYVGSSIRLNTYGWWAIDGSSGKGGLLDAWDGEVVAEAARLAETVVREYLVNVLPPKYQSSSL